MTSFRSHLATAALAPLLALACGDIDPPEPADTRTPDSGVIIVENPRPADGSRLGWRIGPEMAVQIGMLEGDDPYLLDGVTDASRLSDGRIVVVNYDSRELRVFDGAGTHLTTWGGPGEGPNEFRHPVRNIDRLPGDSLVAWDQTKCMVTVMGPTGEVARRFEVCPISPVAVFRDGSMLTSPSPGFRDFGVDSVTVEFRDAEGTLKSSLGRHPGMERHIDGEALTIYGVIFGHRLILAAWGDLGVVTPNTSYEIRAFAQDGSLARIVRRDHEARAPTDADVEGYIEERVSWYTDAETRARERRGFEPVPVSDRLPALASVMADGLDHLWVEEFEPPGEEWPGVLWCVFDPDGNVLGFVETPEGLQIYEIGEDYILGRVRDDLDVPYVQLWPLERVEG